MFYLLDVVKDLTTHEFKSVFLYDRETKTIKDFDIDQDLMKLSLEHDIKICHDDSLNVLVYTAKGQDGNIIYTIKVFKKGSQENLLRNEEFLNTLKRSDIR